MNLTLFPDDCTRCQAVLDSIHQSHLLNFFPQLSLPEKQAFVEDIFSLDLVGAYTTFQRTVNRFNETKNSLLPSCLPPLLLSESMLHELAYNDVDRLSTAVPSKCFVVSHHRIPPPLRDLWTQKGLQLIASRRVAAVILAGGQGTRLGWQHPKGTFPIGPVTGKSLFEILCQKHIAIHQLARTQFTDHDCVDPPFLYIMTSTATHDATVRFFHSNDYFGGGIPPYEMPLIFFWFPTGLNERLVTFFQQDNVPAFDMEGRILLEEKAKIYQSPNGNGGIFFALKHRGILDHMKHHGLLGIHVFTVDNPLTKVLDPIFIGYTHTMGAQVGNKCVLKADPHEQIGVMCLRSNGETMEPTVIEYTEYTSAAVKDGIKETQDENCDDPFVFGNICNHFFTVAFLEELLETSAYQTLFDCHVAQKAIPYIDINSGEKINPTNPNGVKLEYFIFDVLPLANKVAGFLVERDDEFAPLKSIEGSNSVQECRVRCSNLYKKWAQNAGITLGGDGLLEISPLVSYAGEILDSFSDHLIQLPYYLSPDNITI